MTTINDLAGLEALYARPSTRTLEKVRPTLTPLYRQWLERSRFVILSTVGEGGTDCSPRGDSGPVVKIADDSTLLLPDWKGNNRLDSLRNIVTDGRVSLLFMVTGAGNVVRVNGSAKVSIDPGLIGEFETEGRGQRPTSVVVIAVSEVYFQCAKAIMRSKIWGELAPASGLPSAGDFLSEVDADFDGQSYDAGYPDYAKSRLW